jgi:hypothetical protein
MPIVLVLVAPPLMLYTIWLNPVSAAEDDVVYVFPLRKMVGEALRTRPGGISRGGEAYRQGRWPVHNPLEATGSPMMADPQSSVMFPPTWLFAALNAKLAYSLSVFLAFSTAGGGAYVYLRKLKLVRPAAVFGAVAFMFCGFMVGHRVHLPMIQTAAMFPWGLWCVELLRDRGSPPQYLAAGTARPAAAFAWLAPVLFLSAAAGHWAILTYMALAWAVYLLIRARPLARSAVVALAAGLVAAALAAPQLEASFALLARSTRTHIGYATAGENSFFPASAVLALFPMLMGSQTPNFFPQRWWGVWHLSETLSYVGLSTLPLAFAAIWRLGGKRTQASSAVADPARLHLGGLVRLWTWLGVGAFVWMLGYYLPTYRLIYMLPVLGVARCPGRMLLVLDMALAVLAATAVHAVVCGPSGEAHLESLKRAVRRGVTLMLPVIMIATLLLVAMIAWAVSLWPTPIPLPFAGGAKDALASLRPGNPAVWMPLVSAAVTILAVRLWLARPRGAAPLLIVLLLGDLFVITRFVDVPGGIVTGPDPELSPAAAWLRANALPGEPVCVYGVTRDYRDRPAELLSPKTAQGLGIGTLGSYGAWHYPPRAHSFGFDTYGRNRDWAWLIRRNGLLSAYGVRYVLAADAKARRLIESVRIPDSPPRPKGPNLLSDRWELSNARMVGDMLRLKTPFLWWWSQARQPVAVEPGAVYRITLDARGPDDGAANFLRAEVLMPVSSDAQATTEDIGMLIESERIGADWRHFERTFAIPPGASGHASFRIFTMSERAVEVRNVVLAESDWERPINMGGRLKPGQAVYRKAAEVEALDPDDPPVAIYENLLCQTLRAVRRDPQTMEKEIERLRWPADDSDFTQRIGLGVPDLALSVETDPGGTLRLVSLPAAGIYVILLVAGRLLWRRGPGGKLGRRGLQTQPTALGASNPQPPPTVCN